MKVLLAQTFTHHFPINLHFSDGEIEQQQPEDHSEAEEQEVSKKSGKKAKKSKSKKVEESESDGDEAPAKKAPAVSKREAKKKARADDSDDGEQLPSQPISAFALLQGDDSDDVGSGLKSDEDNEPAKKPTKQKKKKKKEQDDGEDVPAATGGKKGKKAKKGKRGESDEEDLDKMLADLQMEYEGVKKTDEPKPEATKAEESKKKDRKKGKAEEPAPEPAQESKPEPEQEKTSKKKDKKKKQTGDEPSEATPPAAQPEAAATEEKPVETTEAAAGAKKKKGPGKAMVAAMQEALKKKKEEEERLLKEEEEKILMLEEADKQREEKARLEQEKKDRKKLKEKERKERLKAEGKLLTQKQKLDKARADAMIESLKAQGVAVPGVGEKRVRPGTRVRPSKQKKEEEPAAETPAVAEVKTPADEAKVEAVEEVTETEPEPEPEPEPVEEIKDEWDASSGEEENEDSPPVSENKDSEPAKKAPAKKQESVEEESESEESESEEESSDESEDDSSSEESDHRTEAEKMRERAELRIRKREAEAETKRTTDNLRAAVVCVLGHVDTGKTKILDKLRRTNVQDGEAGGITQQIGATNVPIENIKENTRHIKNYAEMVFKLPGLLIIDTPGHESFSNLRSRGSSLCDIAILVVDIMHGLEPQTIESLNMLKTRKTPFVVALNKIDRLYDWNTMPRKDIRDIIKSQALNTQQEFDKRVKEVIVQFAEQGMNAAIYYDNPDPRTYISMIPTSAITGEGMGNLLMLVVQFSQNQLAKRLMYSETLQATVLEVKAIPGLGTTIDAILINGKLREGDTMILAGTDGPIVTQVKALLMPQPMKELRVKNAYIEHKEILAAQGVKIAAKELEKAIAGINLQIAQKPDEVEIYK